MQIETLLNVPVSQAIEIMASGKNGKRNIVLGRIGRPQPQQSNFKTVKKITFENYIIRELENGSIEIEQDDLVLLPVKPKLRELALKLNIGLLNTNGNALNTRQLGSQVIQSLLELNDFKDQ